MRAILISFFLLRLVAAQSTAAGDLGAGRLLVATRELSDPNFAKTVVLLVHYDEEGVLGLILNRQTEVPISRVFRELKEAKGRTDTVYAGGPVERTVVLALLRAKVKPDEAEAVLGDVYLISNQELLQKTIAAGSESSRVRVYVGYAGWTVRQLEREVELGAWTILRGDAALVFDADPESLWYRLTRKSEQRIASIIHHSNQLAAIQYSNQLAVINNSNQLAADCGAGFQPAADFQSASRDVLYTPKRPIENRPQDTILPYKK